MRLLVQSAIAIRSSNPQETSERYERPELSTLKTCRPKECFEAARVGDTDLRKVYPKIGSGVGLLVMKSCNKHFEPNSDANYKVARFCR
jgi:hypothetical protein